MRKHILLLAIATFSIVTIKAQTIHLDEDFNTGSVPSGWTNNAVSGTQPWSFGIDGSLGSHAGQQNFDGTNLAFFDDDNLGNSSTDNTAELISPSFDNSSNAVTFLEFDYNFRAVLAASVLDSFYVDVFDGTNWNRVFSRGANDCGNWINPTDCGVLPHANIDISAYANANCQVRFTYFDGNDWGWYVAIDNVEISSPLANDIGVTQILSPESDCGLSNVETIQVRIKNYGALPASNFDIVFDMDNGAQTYTETITATIPATDSLDYTFTATADFSVVNAYAIKTYTDYSVDAGPLNDTVSTIISNDAIFTPTFVDDFEGANNWKVEGTNPSWEMGPPAFANSVINSAISGSNIYATNLGNGIGAAYNNFEESYLVSPCFDFSQGIGDPIVSFNLIYQTEGFFDGLTFESSIDGGVTWQKVGPTISAVNWYGNGANSRWEGNSRGWQSVENVLAGFAGQSQVNFRFRLSTDGSTTFEGAGVDNFAIRFPPPIDISTNELLYPSPTGLPQCGYGLENIIVQLENKGANTIDSIFLGYRVGSSAISVDTFVTSLAPNTRTTYTFRDKYNFSAITTYNIDVWAYAKNDGFSINDTLAGNSITNQTVGAVASMPFIENFDGPGWVPSATNNNFNGSIIGPGWTRTSTSTFANPYMWNVLDGPTGTGNTGPDTDFSGTGKYLYTEADGGTTGDVTILESPCIDLSNNQKALLEFYTHRFGSTNNLGPLRVDVYDGKNWVQNVAVINTNPQTASSSAWTLQSVDLDVYAGRRIKIRFRAFRRGSQIGDMAIDEILLYEPIDQDAEMLQIITPNTSGGACDITATTDFTVEVGNFGINPIPPDSLLIGYQIGNSTPVIDTLASGIPVGGSVIHTFSTPANLSRRGQQYVIQAWTDLNGDSNDWNDSIQNYRVINYTRDGGYTESFESFNFIDGDCSSSIGDVVSNGWSVSSGDYTWNLQNTRRCLVASGATNTASTGPAGDHTLGNGKFFYTEADPNPGTASVGNVAQLLSPCIDFTQKTGATVAYWYHRYGNQMGTFSVDVKVNGNWINGVQTITNQTHFSSNAAWLLGSANISSIAAGNLVQVRFRAVRGTGARGDMALDDIEFFEPIPTDARVSRLISPITECSPSGTVTIEIENFGSADITVPVEVGYQVNGGGVVKDTLVYSPAAPLGIGANATFTFPIAANLTVPNTTYEIKAWTTIFPLDSNTFNDTLTSNVINESQSIDYEEDFEAFVDGGTCTNGAGAVTDDRYVNGWTETSAANSTFKWSVHDVSICGGTPSGGTGPDNDHTTGLGKFLLTEASGTSGTARIESPCIDFTREQGAAMKFWFHRAGTALGNLNVDVFANGVWNNGILVLTGAQQTATNDPWQEADAKFNQFSGQEVRIRFRVPYGGGFSGDVSIDDLSFYAPFGEDARMLAVTAPTSGCLINDQSIVSVRLQNFGTRTINQGVSGNAADSLVVGMQVDGGQIFYDTVRQTIVADQTVDFTFTPTVDLSTRGKKYTIKAWTALIGEEDVENDTITYVVQNNTKITNYKEDFETSRDAKCDEMLGQVLENGWTTPNNTSFNWNVQSSICGKGNSTTPTDQTGPGGDHTTGKGIFLYTEGDGAGIALLESPCIDLTGNTEARLNFWYHRFGADLIANPPPAVPRTPLLVDVFSNGVWNLGVGTVSDQTQNSANASWKQLTVNLNSYVGGLIQVRFRANKITGGGGARKDIGLDDILIYDPIDKDAGVTDIISPSGDGCNVTTLQNVSVEIQNYGKMAINANELYVEYNDNNGAFSRDTVNQVIAPGANIVHTFSQQIDLSNPGIHTIRARTVLNGDSIPQNNLSLKEIMNSRPGIPRYFMDFERHVMGASYNQDNMRGFSRRPITGGPGTYMWHVQCGAAPYVDGGSTLLPMPDIPQTGPSGDHTHATAYRNGDGCYMIVESDVVAQTANTSNPKVPDALLELPCGDIDFTQSANGKVLFSYWYHMFGAETGALYVDVKVDTGWVNRVDVVRGQQQSDETDAWKKRQVSIGRFVAGQNAVRIRFRAENAFDQNRQFEGRGGDIAIDDVEILDRIDRDASIVRLLEPESDCNLTISERLEVRIQNVGTQDMLKVKLGHQITFTPANGGPSIVRPIVKDSVLQTVVPLAFYDFEFDRIDMSEPGEYKIQVWTEYLNDGNSFNDTLCQVVKNTTRPFPSCEDFSDLLYDDIPKTFRDFILPNDWTGTRNGYAFKASIEGGGPFDGHTSGLNDVYLLADDGDAGGPGTPTTITTPCFDLTNTQAANLEFYYRITSPNPRLIIRGIRNGGAPVGLDTITTQAPFWTKRRVVLSDYVGSFTSIEFESRSGAGGVYAIDDVCMVRPAPQQIAFQEFVTPQQGLCFYSDSETVRLRLRNIGLDNIDSLFIVLALDKSTQSFPYGNQFRDTIKVGPTITPAFTPGDRLDVVLDLPDWLQDLNDKTNYFLHAYVLLPGDRDFEDNYQENYRIDHPTATSLPYIIDFEKGIEATGLRFTGGMYTWYNVANNGIFATGLEGSLPGLSGPESDHTFGTLNDGSTPGHHMISQAAAGNPGDAIAAISGCIDLTTALAPEIRYWYHMFGYQMGELYLQFNDDNGWLTVDSLLIEDPDQSRGARTDWKSRTIKLDQYKGKFVKFRFISFKGSGAASNMAIDDISVYDLAAKDIRPISLSDPTSDSSYCYAKENPLGVNLINNGSQDIDFTQDTTAITVIVLKDNQGDGVFVRHDSLFQLVTQNLWKNGVPLPRDSVVTIPFDSTFDMSDTGSFYRFFVEVRMVGDLINTNDTYNTIIKSQRKTGRIYSIAPNDTICFGTEVTLRMRNNFGAVRWEERVERANGNATWLQGFNFPSDSLYYIDRPDTTIQYRARVCPQLRLSDGVDETTDSVQVVVVNPSIPQAIHASRCQNTGLELTLKGKVPSNIDYINFYNNPNGDGDVLPKGTLDPFSFVRDFPETDTLYMEAIINNPNVAGPIHDPVDKPFGSCSSRERGQLPMVIATVNDTAVFDLLADVGDDDTLCSVPGPGQLEGSSVTLDGGQVPGRQDTYLWSVSKRTSVSPEVFVEIDTPRTQTVVVDAWTLSLDTAYRYELTVITDSGCVTGPQMVDIFVDDTCIVGIDEARFRNTFNVHPNPVSNQLNIVHESQENYSGSIRLMTMDGQLIESFEDLDFGRLNRQIDMEALPKGVYIIKVDTEKGSFVEKIVRN